MKILAAVVLSAAGVLAQPAPVIETVAGFDAEGVRADSIGLLAPAGLAVDAAGNVYFSQTARNRVYRVTPDGLLQVAAGNGMRGADGDGGPARDARLEDPAAVAVDEAGNLYIATATAIRAVAAETGVIRTVVKLEEGGPLKSIAWIAAAPDGRLIVADREARMLKAVETATGKVSHVAGSGRDAIRGDFGPAGTAALRMPALVAADAAGNIYYAEQLEPRVRRIDANTGEIKSVPLTAPDEDIPGDYEVASGLAADAAGNLYVAQVYRDRVLRISPEGEVSVAAAGVALPQSVAVNAAGELLIAELALGRIVRTVTEGAPAVVAGNGLTLYSGDGWPARETQLAEPAGLAVAANGDLLVASTLAGRVLRVEAAGTVKTVMGGGDWMQAGEDPSPLKVRLLRPQALLVDANGDLLVSDYDNKLVRRATGDGAAADVVAEVPVASTAFSLEMRQAGALASDGTRLFLSSPSDHHVWVITPEKIKPFAGTGEAGFEGDGGAAQNAQLRHPSGMALDAEGNLYVADTGNHRIRRVEAATGEIKTVWPAGDVDEASLPVGLALDSGGALYAADAGQNRVWKIDVATGKTEVVAGMGEAGFSGDGGPAAQARLNRPCAIAFDKDGKLYIADTGNQRVRRVSVAAAQQ
jgi:sugar lactone lactonase YvrE